MNDFIPRRGLPVGEVLASLSINHIIDRETMTMFSKWYQDTALEDFTKIASSKLNSTNLGAVMDTTKKLFPEGIVDVCIQIFNKIKHLEKGSSALLYDITSTYFYATKIPKVRFGNNKDENDQPQINISLVVTKNEGLPVFFRTYEGNISDVTTIQQLILDIKRIQFQIEAIILDRGMTSRTNLQALAGNQIKFIGGIPLTSNEGHIDVYIFICYLAYLAIALYKNQISANGWEGVREGLDEMGRIRKTTLTIGGEKIEKLTVFTKEQKEILKKLGLEEGLFKL